MSKTVFCVYKCNIDVRISSDLFDGQNGLFTLLSDEVSLAKPEVKNFTRKIYILHKKDIVPSKHSKGEECFTIKHFARDVSYSTV